MGMADPRLWSYVMDCCGSRAAWQPAKPGGRWGGNTWNEVETCPNPRCHTNGGPEWRLSPRGV